ncbi:MAG: peptidoglycan-binding protein LysM [Stenotrophomonas rhizophila]|jgi:nucleoid-associated protein YgaU|uniref:Potassium binding protein Kbp n=1 Tax=Stenotrophomonas rhizophila TaxID=216778 RepID=A0AAP5ADY5_9GAMM|nr:MULTISPECIES: LysM peptidoglycan-binding domain-containing protein [Stenotrophomonas]HBZ47750.1 LysM peptidoglycan-binding domain-containing protein [Stenotrophomonas sp.]AOA73864.1 peptidoglycan-binding protein LysM [Stenotrophomonas rhizophila]MDF2816933.1 peptidoglycan-binding protein LysM [Stenotrophomonas rhizophila]MDQ1061135.1 nucleoid-associated protein YgaU [Stenotrophomonas sp. SORGH_AS_0282]MDQ1107127.1 nucleoid-associated protein YgaU [Stenotrophomonas rhizophila]
MSTDKKADFSGVTSSVDTTAQKVEKADFSGVTASVDTTAEKVGGSTYTVKSGDSLSKIAKNELGDGNAWKKIFEANRDVLDDPDKIFPGQTLKLPPKD